VFNPEQKHAIDSNLRKKMIYDSPGSVIDQRFCLLQNYSCPCYYYN